jgi:hypothetical protein
MARENMTLCGFEPVSAGEMFSSVEGCPWPSSSSIEAMVVAAT